MGQNESLSDRNMKINRQRILLHRTFKMSVEIEGVITFPHGLDGLKLWEAGIVLARFVILHHEQFKGKTVLELGSGVGIGGIAARKWTQCKDVLLTDYDKSVIKNIQKNLKINGLSLPTRVLDWRDHANITETYDILIGSDIVYFGCPVADLYAVFCKSLKPKGVGIIIIPERKNYSPLFLDLVEKDVFDVQKLALTDLLYRDSPLESPQEGFYQYPLLKEIDFYAYRLTRK